VGYAYPAKVYRRTYAQRDAQYFRTFAASILRSCKAHVRIFFAASLALPLSVGLGLWQQHFLPLTPVTAPHVDID
jgi:hypothetical protein